MNNSTSIRPVVLLGAGLLTLLVGAYIGFHIGDDPQSAQSASETSSQAAQGSERALLLESAESLEEGVEMEEVLEAADALSPEMADLTAFLQLGQMDPLAAAEEALSSSNNLESISKLALLLAQASSEDMPGIAELISSQRNGYEGMQQMSMLYYAWGRVDAPSAVAYAEAQGGRQSGMATSVALSSWASLDPASARAWVESSENPGNYRRGLLIGWSEQNPLQALQYLSEQNDEGLMNRWTAPHMARNLIKERGVMALDDLAAMPESRNRRELLEQLADELGETNPVAAASHLSSITDPEILKTAVPELAKEWAQDDPKAAIEFVTKYEGNPELYSRAMAEAIEEWAERDPYEAGQYLNELPASPELDRSVAEYSREAARVDPEGAMSFAVSVNDEKLRAETIGRVARDWKRSSPDDYATWAEANPEIAPKETKK